MSNSTENAKKSTDQQAVVPPSPLASKNAKTYGILVTTISVVVVVGFLLAVYWMIEGFGGGSAVAGGSGDAPHGSSPTLVASAGAGDVAKGKDLYDSSCVACHGQNAEGVPNLGKDLVRGDFAKSQSDAELLAFIKKGRDATDPLNTTHVPMPPKGGNPALTDADIMNIIAYLRTLENQK